MNDNKAMAIFGVALFSMMSIAIGITAYQEGQENQLKIELEIEKEKNKHYEQRTDSTYRND